MTKKTLKTFFSTLYLPFIAVISLFLSSCGEQTTNELATIIQEKNYSQALKILDQRLLKNPADPALHILAVQARLGMCVEEKCFNKADERQKELLNPIRVSLPLIRKESVDLGEGLTMKPVKMLADFIPNIIELPNQPSPLLTMINLLENHPAQKPYSIALFGLFEEAMNTHDETTYRPFIQNTAATQKLPTAQQYYTNLLLGFITNNNPLIRNNTVAIRSRQKDPSLTPQLMGALVPAIYINLSLTKKGNTARHMATNFKPMLDNLGWQHLINKQALTHMEASLQKLRDSGITMPQTTIDEVTEDISQTTPPVISTSINDLFMDNLSLVLNPSQQKLWENFLPKAKEHVLQTQDHALLTSGPDINQIPQEIKTEYNRTLFNTMEGLNEKGQSIIPLISRLKIDDKDKHLRVQIEKLIQSGLEKALENKNLKISLAYARFNPEIAKERRQSIIPVILDSLKKAFAENNFNLITELGDFLSNDLSIDFNLDAILLKELEIFLKQQEISNQLKSDTLEPLLQEQAEIALDLGPKFIFLQKYFIEKPAVLDSVLKTLILATKGKYGTSSALYRLFYLFNETSFPVEEREIYLVSTLRNSFSRDESFSPLEAAQKGYKLHQLHKDISLNFVADETLNRVTTLKEGQEVWKWAPNELKATLKAVRPEFFALMEGVETFNKNKFGEAADHFAQIRSTYYLTQAQPYINHYLSTLKEYKGVYVPEDITNCPLPITSVTITQAGKKGRTSKALSQMNLKILSTVGKTPSTNPQTFSKTYGKTWATTIKGELDFNTKELSLDLTKSMDISVPQKLTKMLSPLISMSLEENALRAKLIDGSTIKLLRITHNSQQPLLPDGTFIIQKKLTASNDKTDHILPTGAIIEIETDIAHPLRPQKGNTLLDIIYPVYGFLKHPITPAKKYAIKGFYRPARQTTNLLFNYPLSGTQGTVTAAARCNIANGQLLCGLHNRHNSRILYHHIVTGTETQESRIRSAKRMEEFTEMFNAHAAAQITATVIQTTSSNTIPTQMEGLLPPPEGFEDWEEEKHQQPIKKINESPQQEN